MCACVCVFAGGQASKWSSQLRLLFGRRLLIYTSFAPWLMCTIVNGAADCFSCSICRRVFSSSVFIRCCCSFHCVHHRTKNRKWFIRIFFPISERVSQKPQFKRFSFSHLFHPLHRQSNKCRFQLSYAIFQRSRVVIDLCALQRSNFRLKLCDCILNESWLCVDNGEKFSCELKNDNLIVRGIDFQLKSHFRLGNGCIRTMGCDRRGEQKRTLQFLMDFASKINARHSVLRSD